MPFFIRFSFLETSERIYLLLILSTIEFLTVLIPVKPFLTAILLITILLVATSNSAGQATDSKSDSGSRAGITFKEADVDSQRVDLMLEYGQEAMSKGNMSEARAYFSRIAHLADSLDFEYGRQLSLYGFGDFYLVQQKYDSAKTVLERADELNPYSSLQSKIKNLLATTYRYQGDNQKAISLYQEVLASIDTTGQVRTAAGIALNMGDAYMNLGATSEAFDNYNKAIAFVEQSEDSLFLATALNNVGESHNSIEEFEDASYYLERSLEISRMIDFKPGQLRALLNLGNTRSSQAKFQEAKKLYEESLELSKLVRPDTPPIQIQYNLGELYNRMGNFEQAEEYFQLSLDNSAQGGVQQGIYYNSIGLGNVASERGNIGSAIQYFDRALEIAESLENPVFLQQTHEKLYELYKGQESYSQALNHLESYRVISDSLNTQEKERMLADHRTRLEVQRKDQINKTLEAERVAQQAQLKLQYWLLGLGGLILFLLGIFLVLLYRSNLEKNRINRKLQDQKKELEESNAVKNKLLSIVAHDLRTPLSAMTGILELVREQSLTEEEMRELFTEMEFSLQQNMNIMENLLVWAKQQMKGLQINKRVLNAREMVEDILESHRFNARHKQIALENKLEADLVVEADYDLLKLVLRNLISNSIKFSGSGDTITVEGSEEEAEVCLKVRDTGIGIPEEIQDKIFEGDLNSRKGTRDEKGSGLGLNLCKEFIEKQGGSISFESKEGEGTTFYITLASSGLSNRQPETADWDSKTNVDNFHS